MIRRFQSRRWFPISFIFHHYNSQPVKMLNQHGLFWVTADGKITARLKLLWNKEMSCFWHQEKNFFNFFRFYAILFLSFLIIFWVNTPQQKKMFISYICWNVLNFNCKNFSTKDKRLSKVHPHQTIHRTLNTL